MQDPHGAWDRSAATPGRLQALSRPAAGEDDHQDHHWMLVGDERQGGEWQGRPGRWLAKILCRPQPQDRLPPLFKKLTAREYMVVVFDYSCCEVVGRCPEHPHSMRRL
jgi:hypothetical protein